MRVATTFDLKKRKALADRSQREADNLAERALRCPVCGFKIGVAYSDSTGHIRTKCQKCKDIRKVTIKVNIYRLKSSKRRRSM